MAQILTNLGHLNVADRLSPTAQQEIISYVNNNNALQVVINESISVKNPGGTYTTWDLNLRIDLGSPRAGAHGGIQCPHAQVTQALRHGGKAKFNVARDRRGNGESFTRNGVNYDRIRLRETYALNSIETVQVCRNQNLTHGVLNWLQKICKNATN